MTQDTRKDPRAKVLTMTVRYKSATLDEFIEHHSHDVSRGGMFIKTPSPFPPGTLLKFEVKIAAEQRVMQGVGRVVWKREAAESSEVRPAGMGVKFIKIDDESRRVIDQLVTARGDGQSHFEQGADGPGMPAESPARATPPKVEQPEPSAAPPRAARKSTMIGLGAMGETPAPPPGPAEAFFPKSNDIDMPAPEDRTVMKQAAELLQEALREAGGSLDEVGSASVASSRDAKPPAPSSSKPDSRRAAEELAPQSTKPKSMTRPAAEKPTVPAVPAEKPKPAAAKPVAATAARPVTAAQRALGTESSEGGGGKIVLVVAAVALVAGVVFFATRQEAPAPEAPSAEPAAALPPPEAASPPTTAVAPPAAPTPPVESGAAAPPASAAAPPTPPPPAEPPLPPPVPAPVAVPKAAARAAVRAKPKAAVEAAPSEPAAPPAEAPAPKPTPAEAKPAPTEPKPAPAEAKPAEPPATKPAATPKPAPAPAPKKPASNGDNPY
jgi:uncharacterized protein (TIGR02266 family)